ncbi:MAG: DNA repair protein RecO [Candidatus Kerfeldbacteria bacterium]|nr:DNA repair protein RecO [Candidatus Kerfeldbacteria bacterium]
MSTVIRTKALILRHTDDREHDRQLVVLTPNLGQQQIRARGTKKSISKLGGSLEPLMEVDMMVANGRVVDVVTGSIIRRRWPRLRSDLIALVSAQWLFELVERVTKPNQPEPGLYPLVVQMLEAMTGEIVWSSGRRWLLLLRRAWQILQHEGFAPSLERCGFCHRPLSADDLVFQPLHGFVHRAEAQAGYMALSTDTVDYLRNEGQPNDQRQIFRQVRQLLRLVIEQTLDRPLQSDQVLQSVMRFERLSGAAVSG